MAQRTDLASTVGLLAHLLAVPKSFLQVEPWENGVANTVMSFLVKARK